MARFHPWLAAVAGAVATGSVLIAACGGGAATAPTSGAAPTVGAKTAATAAATTSAPQTSGSPAVAAKVATGEPIKIGELIDLTGPTAETARMIHIGRDDYINFVTKNGGVNGRPVQLITIDDKYEIPLSVEGFKKLTTADKVQAMFFSSTGNTEAMVGQVKQLKMPSITSSGADAWADPKQNPYHFITLMTYNDQTKVILQWIKENWKDTSRKAKVGYAYPDNPFGKAPLQTGKDEAAKLGMDWVGEWIVPFGTLDTTSQVLNMKEKGVDWVIHQNQGAPNATLQKDARKAGLTAQFIGTNYASDENFMRVGAGDVEGAYGFHAYAFPYSDAPGAKTIRDLVKARGGNTDELTINYVEGWLEATAMIAGMKNAGSDLSGDSVIKGFEKIQNLDTGGLSAPMNFSSTSHVGTQAGKVYQIKSGKWEPITDFLKVK